MPPNEVQKSLCLQPEAKQLLISCIKARPEIWDVSNSRYGDAGARKRIFNEIAQILGQQNNTHYKPQEIQIEWKKMRDVFNRTLKKVMNSNGKSDISWRYFHDIKFIASPDQLAFINTLETSDKNDFDPYGLKQFLGNSSLNNEDDSEDLGTIDLNWIAERCAEQQNEIESSKNEGSSSYDEPPTTTQTDDDNGTFDQAEQSVFSRKRRHVRSSPRENDTYDAFGLFVASQLRSLYKRNRIAGANLQRALLEVCLKSELDN